MRMYLIAALAALASAAAQPAGDKKIEVKEAPKVEKTTGTAPQGTETSPIKSQPSRKADPREVEVRFVNGSKVVMTLMPEQIEVVTKFGKLTIPPEEIRYIEFGLHLPPGAAERIQTALAQLDSNNYKQREAALKELIALGAHAYPTLQNAAKSAPMESGQRIKQALKTIEQKVPEHLLRVKEEDLIQTSKFALSGKIVTPVIKAKAEYFGDLELKPPQLRSIRRVADAVKVEILVDAAKHGRQNAPWMDTGFKVEANSKLMISASGEIDMNPQQPGQMAAGPNGMNNRGFNVNVGFRGGPGMGLENLSPGTLLGRIGDKGPVFIVGDRYSGTASRGGKLHLLIFPVNWGAGAAGSYNVRLSAFPNVGEDDDE
jgi:hypothetical protein